MKITNTYLFSNGMVATFNKRDEQVPALQGRLTPELYQKICEAADKNTEWHGDWVERIKVFMPVTEIS